MRHLASLGLRLSYEQDPRTEFEFGISSLAADLRSGVRLLRLTELLTGDSPCYNRHNIAKKCRSNSARDTPSSSGDARRRSEPMWVFLPWSPSRGNNVLNLKPLYPNPTFYTQLQSLTAPNGESKMAEMP